MKILVLSHMFPTPSKPINGVFVAEQVRELRSFGLDVDVFSCQRGGADDYQNDDSLFLKKMPNFNCFPKKLRMVFLSMFYLVFAFKHVFSKKNIRGPYDVIHAHYGFPDGFVGVCIGLLFRIPVVVTLHGSDYNVQFNNRLFAYFMAKVLAHANKIICVSAVMESELIDRFVFLSDITVHIPNGYNDKELFFTNSQSRSYLLFVGNLVPVKCVDVLLKAYALALRDINIPLHVVGDGVDRPQLESLANRLGIEDNVLFMGKRYHVELNPLFNNAIAFVLPSKSEGMPIVVLEAMATGTPVVASAVGGIPELVPDNSFGTLVPSGDVVALKHALVHAVNTKWDNNKIHEFAANRTWAEYSRKLSCIYKRLCAHD